MIDLGRATNDDERRVLRFLQAIEDGDLATRIDSLCDPSFVWANSGLPTLRGVDQVRSLMSRGGFASELPILAGMTHFSVDLLHLASRRLEDGGGAIVFTERVDHHWAASGSDLMTPHIAGVAEVRDGRLLAFRDFYDTACYAQTPSEPDPAFTLASFRERTRARTAD